MYTLLFYIKVKSNRDILTSLKKLSESNLRSLLELLQLIFLCANSFKSASRSTTQLSVLNRLLSHSVQV